MIESFMCLLGFDEVKAREAVDVYREYFRETGIYENSLYDGIEDLLACLAGNGKKLILATSKAEVFALKILEHFNISRYFCCIVGSELDGTRIKKGEVIRYALHKSGVLDSNSAVMVGDREHDIYGASENGIDSIGALYGYGSFEELENAGATMIVESIEELKKVLTGQES